MPRDPRSSDACAQAAMMEKERALNEVQGKREALWAQREALVSSMQGELSAEQARMAAVWQQSQGAWQQLQTEHNELRVELQQRRLDGERDAESLQREIERVGEQLQVSLPPSSPVELLAAPRLGSVALAHTSHRPRPARRSGAYQYIIQREGHYLR